MPELSWYHKTFKYILKYWEYMSYSELCQQCLGNFPQGGCMITVNNGTISVKMWVYLHGTVDVSCCCPCQTFPHSDLNAAWHRKKQKQPTRSCAVSSDLTYSSQATRANTNTSCHQIFIQILLNGDWCSYCTWHHLFLWVLPTVNRVKGSVAFMSDPIREHTWHVIVDSDAVKQLYGALCYPDCLISYSVNYRGASC